MKDIYLKTNNLIYKYRNIIHDELHITDFNDSNIPYYELCISLLVKIEDDDKLYELETNFIDRFKYLIIKKFDEIFSIGEGISEINYTNFSRIYDNYEFAINENEYLFYEQQLEELDDQKKKESNIGNLNNIKPYINNIDCKNLNSKFFKKGTFIWICKKINENVIQNYLTYSYNLFIKLFGKEKSEKSEFNLIKLENLFIFLIDLFYKKLNDLIGKNKEKNEIDPIFLKEGLNSFYYPYCECLQKINEKEINSQKISNKILQFNENILNKYLKQFYLYYLIDSAKLFENSMEKIFINLIKIKSNLNLNFNTENSYNNNNNNNNFLLSLFSFNSSAKIFQNSEFSLLNNKFQQLIQEKINIIIKLDIEDVLNLNEEKANLIHLKIIEKIYDLPFYLIKSFNFYKNDFIKFNLPYFSEKRNNLTKEEKEAFDFDLEKVKKKVKEILNKEKFCKLFDEKIYNNNNNNYYNNKDFDIIFNLFFIFFLKNLEDPKTLNEKFLKNFPSLKSNKQIRNELKGLFENNNKYTLFSLNESLIQIYENYIFNKLKILFFEADLFNCENVITFRLPLRELLVEMFNFKKKILLIMKEEAKIYNETKLSTVNDAFILKKKATLTRFEKEMLCLSIRRLGIFNLNKNEEIYPQTMMLVLVKTFLKVIFFYFFLIFFYYFLLIFPLRILMNS